MKVAPVMQALASYMDVVQTLVHTDHLDARVSISAPSNIRNFSRSLSSATITRRQAGEL
jgi:hypothetical protein